MKTFKLAHTAVAALALCAGLAQAGEVVTQWSITDNAVFVPSSVQPAGNTAPNPVLSNDNQTLTWGTPAGDTAPSSLAIDNTGNPFTVNTGVLAPTISITHNNFPIFAPSLTSVDILATLTLKSLLPNVGVTTPDQFLTFGVTFLETPNSGTDGFCADGAQVGSGGVNVNGCADIFVIDQDSLNFPFIYDDNQYFFSVFANGLGTLSNAACAAVGATAGCRGFETVEADSTTATFNVLITSTPFQVPEPGSMALLGGALAALALAGRRRKQQKD